MRLPLMSPAMLCLAVFLSQSPAAWARLDPGLRQDTPTRLQDAPSPQHDSLQGLADYGYRYYDPFMGRWPSRDPIGERGGFNVYEMARNAVTYHVDPKGQDVLPEVPNYDYLTLPPKTEQTFTKTVGKCRFEALLSFYVIGGYPAHPLFRYTKKEGDDCCTAVIGVGGGIFEFGEQLGIEQLVGEDPNWWTWGDPPGSTQDPQEIQRVGLVDHIRLDFREALSCQCPGNSPVNDMWNVQFTFP